MSYNKVKIRRGSGTPDTNDVSAYELAYDYANNRLWIHDGDSSSMVEITNATSVTLGGHTINDVDIGSEFNDVDDHLMTSGAIKEKIESYSYLTSVPNHSAALLTSGTVPLARISGLTTDNIASDAAIEASKLNDLPASKITSGTIPSARLDADTAHLSGTQTFSGAKTFSTHTKITGVGSSLYFDTTGSASSNFIRTINDYETVIANSRGSAGHIVLGNSNIRLGFGSNHTNAETDIYINPNGNVGIGNSSPASWLDVSKDNSNSGNQFVVADTEGASAAVRTYTTSSPAGLILNHYYAVGGNPYMRYADIVANVGSGAATTMRFITKNSSNAYSTTVINDSGSVGIGTASPSAKLHVDGSAIFDTDTGNQPFYLTRLGSTDQALKMYVDDNSAVIESVQDETSGTYGNLVFVADSGSTGAVIDFKHGTATKMRLEAHSGNLGIGTASPLGVLNVIVPTYSNRDTDAQHTIIANAGDAGKGLRIGYDNSGHKAYMNVLDPGVAWGDLIMQDGAGKIGIGTASPQKKLHIFQTEGGVGVKHATIRLGGYSTVGPDIAAYRHTGNSNDQGLIFSTYHNSNGTTDTMTLDSLGNVGIGTTSPQSILHIGTGNTARHIKVSDNRAMFGYDGGNAVVQGGNTKGIKFNTGSDTFTSNTRMTITSAGNVGIGVTGGTYKLQIPITEKIGYYGDSTHLAYWEPYNGSTGHMTLSNTWGGGNAHILLIPDTNVGIGTTSPSYKLDVAGQGKVTNGWLVDNGTTAGFFTTDSDNVNFGSSTSGKGLKLFSANAEAMRIDSSGNIGVGTVSPGSLLTVYKDGTQVSNPSASYQIMTVSNSNGGIAIQAGASSDAFLVFGDYGQYDAGRIRYHNSTHHMSFCTGGNNPRMTIQDDGHIAITNTKRLIFDGVDGNTYINQNTGSSSRLDFTVNGTGIMDLHSTYLDMNGYIQASYNANPDSSATMALNLDGSYGGGIHFLDTKHSGIWCLASGTEMHFGVGGSSYASPGSDEGLFMMQDNGTFHADADVVAYSTSVGSDIKLKKNVEDISYGLDDVLKMRAVEFDWKEKRQGKHDIGVIAQELEKIIPEVVQETKTIGGSNDTHKVVDYSKLTSVLIKAIQQQQEEIDLLKANYDDLKYNRR